MVKTKKIVKKSNKVNYVKYYKVILHNDKVNDFSYVKDKVKEVFRFKEEKAVKITMEAHSKNIALCSVEPLEHAEFRKERLASFKINSTIEPD